MRRWFSLVFLLAVGALATPGAQTLSSQVLQLLIRTNVWTGKQTFNDLRLPDASPADTSARLYQIGGSLYWNGGAVAGAGGGPTLHTLLGSSHSDTSAAAVARGALITGQGGTPAWARLVIGSAGTFLRSDGTDIAWGTDGSALTTLNAGQLATGTIPLARISGLTNTEIASGASIGWTKLDKTGSSLADFTTRSAGDLSSGTLADARLSGNVSLFGASVDNAEVTNATLTFAKWASNSCIAGQYPQYDGANWICGTVTPGSGTVTSVGLSMPAIFSVTGSPVTGSGTLAATLATQSANLVWAGPSTGAAASPTFRSLVYNDLPTSAAAAGTYPKVTINAQGIVTGTATQITLTTDVTGVLPLANGGTGLNAASDDSVLLSNGSAWAAVAINNCGNGLTYATATNTFGCLSTVASHALLSASHTDTAVGTVVRGDLIVGTATPQWARFPIGANHAVLTSNGSDPSWQTEPTVDGLQVGTSAVLNRLSAPTGNDSPGFLINGWGQSAAAASVIGLQIGGTVNTTSGTVPIAVGVSVAPLARNSGSNTVTDAASLYIVGPPTFATNNYALYISSGAAWLQDGLYERGRTVKLGDWQSITYASGNFTASGSLTWTVDSGDVSVNRYTDIGTTMWWSLGLTNTSTSGTASTELRVTLPASRTISATTTGTCAGVDNGTEVHTVWTATSGNTYVSFFRTISGANWSNASTNATSIRCTIPVVF